MGAILIQSTSGHLSAGEKLVEATVLIHSARYRAEKLSLADLSPGCKHFRGTDMSFTIVTEALAWVLKTVKSALSRRAVADLPTGEQLVKDTEASVTEVDKLAAGTVK